METGNRLTAIRGEGKWGLDEKDEAISQKNLYTYHIDTEDSMVTEGKEQWGRVGGGEQRRENGDRKRLCLE